MTPGVAGEGPDTGEAFCGLRWFRVSGTAPHPDLGYGVDTCRALLLTAPAVKAQGGEHLL